MTTSYEEKYTSIESLVKVKQNTPTIPTKTIINLISEVLHPNPVAHVLEGMGEGENITDTNIVRRPEFEPVQEEEAEAKIIEKNGGTFAPQTLGNGNYDKKFELIGQIGSKNINMIQHKDNPWGIKVGYFEKCEKCGLVGMVTLGTDSHYTPKPHTYLYKKFTHYGGRNHMTKIMVVNAVKKYDDLVKMYHKKGAS